MAEDTHRYAVSRRIAAPAHRLFALLADPRRHVELDGSGLLRGAVGDAVISGPGDVFVMRMHHESIGDFQNLNHVVVFEPDRLIGWEPEAGLGHPFSAPDSPEPARWGQRWTYELVPDGDGATVVTESYDCAAVHEPRRAALRGGAVWAENIERSLDRLEALAVAEAGPSGGGGTRPAGGEG